MKTVKKGLIVAVFMLSIIFVKAQEQTRKEKMEALKIAYITEKLELTESEAKNFWPIFNDYQSAKKDIHGKKSEKKKPNFDEMSEQEIESFIDNKITNAQKLLDLKKEYLEKFKKILPIKKVAKLLQAERGFKKEVLKRMRQNK